MKSRVLIPLNAALAVDAHLVFQGKELLATGALEPVGPVEEITRVTMALRETINNIIL